MKIQGGINVTGDGNIVNIAGKLESIRIAINKPQDNSDLQYLLKTLVDQIDLAAQANSEKTNDLVENLEKLVAETHRQSPDKKWYELSLQGIKDAATAIGEIGKPILNTLAALKPLLLI